ncbi:MAG: type II toxin-antitoxin system Phd/YefM family antitoxin [Dermatophilaceae bacterium]
MSTVIPQRDLRNHNARIIERVVAGESFVVTRDGIPVADVTPHVPAHRPPRFPRTDTLVAFVEAAPSDAEAWLDDIRSSDRFLDDRTTTDPWGPARG